MRVSIPFGSRKGTSMVVVGLALVAVMGFASLSIDIGILVGEKAKLTNAADAAALAGAQELIVNKSNAVNVANSYLEKNGINPSDAEVTVAEDGNSIKIAAKKNIKFFFAKVLGHHNKNITANATVKTMPVYLVISGIRPFAVQDQELIYGETYILKDGAGDGLTGNYGLLALGGTGSNNLRDNITEGYSESLKVGDFVNTEPGVKKGPTEDAVKMLINSCSHSPKCTFDSYHSSCPRIITIVVVNTIDVTGRSPVEISGFASFFLEDVYSLGGHTEIKGKFIRTITDGELSETQKDYGIRGIKLVD